MVCGVVLGVVGRTLPGGLRLGSPWRVLPFELEFPVAGEVILLGDDIIPSE